MSERRRHAKVDEVRLRPNGQPDDEFLPPQWLDCDLRKLDTTVLGKFDVIMADPPWDSE